MIKIKMSLPLPAMHAFVFPHLTFMIKMDLVNWQDLCFWVSEFFVCIIWSHTLTMFMVIKIFQSVFTLKHSVVWMSLSLKRWCFLHLPSVAAIPKQAARWVDKLVMGQKHFLIFPGLAVVIGTWNRYPPKHILPPVDITQLCYFNDL